MIPAVLALEDGRVFEGVSAGAEGTAFGEVVFNTAMSGYQEALTDPSYRGQIVVMTASHIGNYGVNEGDVESDRIQVAGFAAHHFPTRFSGPRGQMPVTEALRRAGVVGIDGLDTRALVRHLRTRGVMRGAISSAGTALSREALIGRIREQPTMDGAALALTVGTSSRYEWTPPAGTPERAHIAAVDYGIKRNILRKLGARGIHVSVFPASTPSEVLLDEKEAFNGFFLSNGPGDPSALPECVRTVERLVGSGKPLFGICLGHQILGLALSGKTFKLKFGHRGVNHPVKDLVTGQVAITSQNHGFAVDPSSFPPGVEMTHVNLNDETCEGFRVKGRPVFAVQYHPESAPGPHDSDPLFDQFVSLLEADTTRQT